MADWEKRQSLEVATAEVTDRAMHGGLAVWPNFKLTRLHNELAGLVPPLLLELFNGLVPEDQPDRKAFIHECIALACMAGVETMVTLGALRKVES
jgi:hypothetical protein